MKMGKVIVPLLIVALIGLLPAATPLCGLGAGYMMGYYPGIMEPLRQCRLATEVLGDDIQVAPIGMSCGTAETRGGFGIASWTLPVKGTRDDGDYSFYMERHGSDWTLFQAQLEAGDRLLDVKNCRWTQKSAGGGQIRIAPDGQRPLGPNLRRNRF